MAISPDPVKDLARCAQLLDQAVTLINAGSFESLVIVTGVATRIRTNVAMVEQGKRGDDPDFDA